MKALAYRVMYSESASIETDLILHGDGTDATPLSVESAPMIDDNVYQLRFELGKIIVQGLAYSSTDELEGKTPVTYEHDLKTNPFSNPSGLEVQHNDSLEGNGTALDRLGFKPNLDDSLTGKNTVASPLCINIQHNTTLGGLGSKASPLSVVWAPEAEIAYQLQDTAEKKSLSIEGDRIRLAGTLEDSTTINYSVPFTRNPFYDGVIHDETLTGDGLL
jgi:hypothetical protein